MNLIFTVQLPFEHLEPRMMPFKTKRIRKATNIRLNLIKAVISVTI
jgi:hypothetical protein